MLNALYREPSPLCPAVAQLRGVVMAWIMLASAMSKFLMYRRQREREAFRAKMLSRQRGKCAMCKATFPGGGCVDHCHTTGRVRGLICNTCNVDIARMRETVVSAVRRVAFLKVELVRMQNIVRYLRKCERIRVA